MLTASYSGSRSGGNPLAANECPFERDLVGNCACCERSWRPFSAKNLKCLLWLRPSCGVSHYIQEMNRATRLPNDAVFVSLPTLTCRR